jgi:hypothetical protein
MIAYTPEEIIAIGEREFKWCVHELKKASRDMGYQGNWKEALEEVKHDFVEPGKQTDLVRDLTHEAISFVEEHQLVTVPPLAKETWQMFMMSPERQKRIHSFSEANALSCRIQPTRWIMGTS